MALIAQASLQSSISFLDFLGINGQNQSLSIITFDLIEGDGPKLNSDNIVSRCQSKGYALSSDDYKVVDLRDSNWNLPMQRSLKAQ